MVPMNGSELAGALRRLTAERDVLRTLHQACHTIDDTDVEAWLDCYTEDAVFRWRPADEGEYVLDLRSRDDFRTWFSHHRARMPVGTQRHITLNPVVHIVDDDNATVVARYLTLQVKDGTPVPATEGRYDDRFVRGADGRWRLALRSAVSAGTVRGADLRLPAHPTV
jgi:3-phenylpropionate/cinnamic acid dioxygenase small subunit